MSASDRQLVRAEAKAALVASAYLAGFTEISAWAQSVDVAALPAWAVATPREMRDRVAQTRDQRELTLAIVIKRVGAEDIEDQMDADADAIEAALMPALINDNRDCDLTQTETRVDGDGAQRVGTLTMAFTITYWVDDLV